MINYDIADDSNQDCTSFRGKVEGILISCIVFSVFKT